MILTKSFILKTLTIKIINNKALKLLKDLEDLSIIQIVKDQSHSISKKNEAKNNYSDKKSDDLYGTSIERLLAASDDDDDYTNICVLENNPLYKNDKTR